MSIIRFGRFIPSSLRDWDAIFRPLNAIINQTAEETTVTVDRVIASNVPPLDVAYVVLAANDTLSEERVLVVTAGELTQTDNGAGSTLELGLEDAGTPGTYTKVTTDSKGRVASGATLDDADIPSTIARDTEVTAAVAAHAAASDPHPQYLTTADFAALPGTDPKVAGTLWNDDGIVKISKGVVFAPGAGALSATGAAPTPSIA